MCKKVLKKLKIEVDRFTAQCFHGFELFFHIFLETPQSSYSLVKAAIFIAQKNKFKEVICALPYMFCLLKPDSLILLFS